MAAKVFADFSGGEWGTFDPAKVPDNFFSARNMLVYRSGALGPRPGFKLHNIGRTPTGNIDALGYIESGSRSLVYMDGGVMWTAHPDSQDVGSWSPTNLGTVTAPNARIPAHIYDVTDETGFMHVNAGRTHRIRPNVGVVEDCNTSGGVAGCVYGLRLMRADGAGRRFYYSATNNAFSWPSANFQDIAISNKIVYMAEQRGQLTIVTSDGSWWVMTGVPGVNDTLRRATGGRIVPPLMAPESFIDVGDDLIHYLNPVNNYPGSFNGVEHSELPYLSMTPELPLHTYAVGGIVAAYNQAKAIQGADNSSPGFILPAGVPELGNGRMLLQHNGIWTLHTFEIPLSQFWASNGRGRIFAFGWTGSNASGQMFTTQLRLDRPAFTSDTTARPGDNSSTPLAAEVTFPEEWSDDGDELRVKEVMVDFIRWNTGAAEQNRIQATVTAMGRGSEVTPLSETRTWEQPGSSSPATQDGTKDRVRFGFGNQGTGAGWRLRLHGLRGVAIRAVVVNYDKVAGDTRLY